MAVTNKVPNSTDKSEWQGDYGYGDYWELLLTAKSGYKFDGEIKAAYTDIDGNPQTVVLQPRNSSNLEVRASVYDTDEYTDFEITGNTRLDNELTVTNNIPNTTATGVKSGSYGGSVTVNANEGFIITSAKTAFTDVDGNPANVDMTISGDGKSVWQLPSLLPWFSTVRKRRSLARPRRRQLPESGSASFGKPRCMSRAAGLPHRAREFQKMQHAGRD